MSEKPEKNGALHNETIGLCLSGGGFRASLFHLGVLKRLDELKILDRVTHLSAVSGGSVTAALYVFLKHQNGRQFQFKQLEEKLLAFVKEDPARRWLLQNLARRAAFQLCSYPLGPLGGFLLGLMSPTAAFDRFFQSLLFHKIDLRMLNSQEDPDLPHLILNATGLEFGQPFYFTPNYSGPDQAAAFNPAGGVSLAAQEVKLSFAVGASSCVPGIFPPSALNITPYAVAGVTAKRAHLVDGGVYDNQGVGVFLTDPFQPQNPQSRVDYIILSDASRTLEPKESGLPPWYDPFKLFNLLSRAHDITEDHARLDRFELLMYKQMQGSPKQAAFFHTAPRVPALPPWNVPRDMSDLLSRLRTDFDRFSDLEIGALMYHGYTLADFRVLNHCPALLNGYTIGENTLESEITRLRNENGADGKASVSWEDLRPYFGTTTPPEPMRWGDFWKNIEQSLPRNAPPNTVRRILDRTLQPVFGVQDLSPGTIPEAWRSALSHLKRGSINCSVWRDLLRLGDRSRLAFFVSFFLRWLIILSVVAVSVHYLLPLAVGVANRLENIGIGVYGAIAAVLLWWAL